MNRSEFSLKSLVGSVRRSRHWAALLAFVILAPACGGGGGGGGFFLALALQFQQATFTVSESGGSATITVSRVGTSAGAVSVNYAAAAGTTTGGDFTATNGTLSWADGDAADKTFTVTITNDGATEGNETVLLSLSLPTGGAILGTPSTSVLTIIDDEAAAVLAGVLQFDSATYSVNENGGTATITVTRSGGSAGAVTVDFTNPGPNSATGAGTDYTFTGGTLSWAAGNSDSKTFTVAIVNDPLLEPSETLTLGLATFTGGAVPGTTATTVLTILDDDSPASLQFSGATYNVSESGVTATITVTRTGGVGNAVGATFATGDNTATVAGLDYAAATGTVTWAAGDPSDKTFTVSITGDATVEGNETINLALTTPTGSAVIGAQSTAVLTIVDDDCTLQFTAASYDNVEGIGTATITVSRIGSTVGAVSVDFSNPAGGTATGTGTDYTFAAGTLSWAIGDSANKTISIPLAADALAEGNETLNLLLANVSGVGALPGTQLTSVVNLIDDDVLFQFSSAVYAVGEAGGTATITVNRVGSSTGIATVNWTSPGTGTATGGDYTTVPGTLTWPDGNTTPRTFTVAITSDTVAEGNETVNLGLSTPATTQVGGSAGLGTPSAAVLTITDDDVNLQFSSATYGGLEGAGVVTITVTRLGLITGACSVNWSITGGTAVVADFSGTPGALVWGAGDPASKTFTITPLTDGLVEGSQTINLLLSGAVGATVGTQNTAVFTIADADVPSATIDNVTVSEGAAGTVNFNFTVTLSAAPAVAGSLQFATANGTATSGSDYTALPLTTLNFGIGVTTMPVTVVVNGDTTDEASETFFVNLSNPVNLNITDAQGQGTITNDDNPTLTINNRSLPETNGGTTTFDFTVTLSNASFEDVTVHYSTANGTATTGNSDYVAIGDTTLTIPAGQLTGTINVTVNGDTTDEADETFQVDLFNLGNVSFGGPNFATGTIQNDDNPTVTIGAATITEGTGGTVNLVFPLTLSNQSLQNVVVTFSTGDISATVADSDYTPVVGGTSTITAPSTTGSITIVVNSDAVDEANETFTVTMTNATNAAIGGGGIATGTITDDDGPTITINDVAQVETNAGQSTFQFTVTLSGTSLQDVTVNYATANGTATSANSDYVPISGSRTILAGNTTAVIDVLVNGDTTGEPDETFFVNLSGAVNGTITDSQGQGTIQTDDAPGITINDVPVLETNGGTTTATFMVTLSNTHVAGITVNYTTADGIANPANAGSDYVASTNTVVIGAGLLTGNIVITINGDTTGETNETFFVNLTGTTFGTIVDNQGLGTILNDDGPNITITQSTVLVEGTGAGTTTYPFTVSVSMNPTSPVTVNYTTTDGSATAADLDYTPNANTLTFNPGGPLIQTVNVTIGRDTKHEPNETFTVDLSGASGGTITVPFATGTINNDDTQPTISINSPSMAEGNAGFAPLNFSVTLSNPSYQTITVQASTVDNSATLANSDYQAVVGATVTFNPGVTGQTLAVNVNGDATVEPNETFFVNLSGAVNATVPAPQGTGTITNDEGPDISSTLPVSGATGVLRDVNLVITFTVSMNKASVESRLSITPGPVPYVAFWDTPGGNPDGTILTVVFDPVAPTGTITGNDLLADNSTVYTWTITAGAAATAGGPTMTLKTGTFQTIVDGIPASIVSITPDPRTNTVAAPSTMVFVFNDTMNTANGTAQVDLRGQNDNRFASVGNPDPNMTVVWTNSMTLTVTFSPALLAGSAYRLQIWGLSDDSNNYANSNNEFAIATSKADDGVAPTVTALIPAGGAAGVSRDTAIFIGMKELMNPSIKTKVTVTGGGVTPADYQINYEVGGDGIVGVQVTPRKAWPPSTTMTITVDGTSADVGGRAMGPNFTSTFTTSAGNANPISIDDPFSAFKNNMVDTNVFNINGFVLFKYASGARAYFDVSSTGMSLVDVSIVEQATGLPVKSYAIRPQDYDLGFFLELERIGNVTSLKNNTAYTITFKNTIKGSMGGAFTQTVYTFTTVGVAGNGRPMASGTETEFEQSPAGILADLQAWFYNDDGPSTSVTAQDDVDAGFNKTLTLGGGNFQYNSAGNEAGLLPTVGNHTLTYTINDGSGLPGHIYTIKDMFFIYPAADVTALTPSPLNPPGGFTPTFNWSGTVPASVTAMLVIVLDAGNQSIREWLVPRTDTQFITPADMPLPAGTYSWALGYYHSIDGTIRDNGGFAMSNSVGFTR